jgi:hypothetical protein
MRIYSNLELYAKALELERVTPRHCYDFLALKVEAEEVSCKPVTRLLQAYF